MQPSPTPTQLNSPAVTKPLQTSGGERFIRRALRVPSGAPTATDDQAHRLASASLALSALRCLLTYVVAPVLAPIIGPATGDRPAIGIPLSMIALVFDVRAVRRFWLADHPWRRKITAVYGVVAAMVLILLVHDVIRILS